MFVLIQSIRYTTHNYGEYHPRPSSKEERQDECVGKQDVVESVCYQGGLLSKIARNKIYEKNSLPGVGRRILLSEEEAAEKKVRSKVFCIIQYHTACMFLAPQTPKGY